MTSRRLVALGMIAWTCAQASAQSHKEMETGSMIPIPERARIPDTGNEADRGRIALAQFARCTVDRHGTALQRVLQLPVEQATDHRWAVLADDECLNAGEMRFKAMLLRGALFMELVRRREAKALPRPMMASAYASPSSSAKGDDAGLQVQLLGYANCVVREDRLSATALIVAPTASTAENAALTTLRPALSNCLPPGQQIKFSRPVLEGVIAEILYRPPAPAVSEVH